MYRKINGSRVGMEERKEKWVLNTDKWRYSRLDGSYVHVSGYHKNMEWE